MNDIIKQLQSIADRNGDGKIDLADLNEIKDQAPQVFEQLKGKADINGDGKISMDDVQGVDFGDMLGNAKDMLGGIFGKK